jgi:hypothetical protein
MTYNSYKKYSSFFKLILIIFSLFSIVEANAQTPTDWTLAVDGVVYEGSSKVEGSVVILTKDGVEIERTVTSKNGKFKFFLKPGGDYLVSVTKNGYVTKSINMNTKNVPPTLIPEGTVIPTNPDVTIFKEIEGVDFSILDQPIGRMTFNPKLQDFEYDRNYTVSIQKQLEKMMADIAAKEAEEKAKRAKYEKLIVSADKKFSKDALEDAKKDYLEAQDLQPKEKYPKDKLKEIETKLAALAQKNAEDKALNDRYFKLISSGDMSFVSEDLEAAKKDYKSALDLKPTEKYPKDKITEIDNLIAQKNKKEAEQKAIEEQYKNFINQGKEKFIAKDYQNSKLAFESALKIIPNQSFALDKIAEIDRILAEQKEKENEGKNKKIEYDKLIAAADKLFVSKDYITSRAEYEKAAALISTEKYPRDKIAEIEKLLADSKAKEEADKKAKEEADRLAKLEADKKAKEEADRLAKLEADKKAKEEADRLAKLEADKKAKEEADRLAKLEADKKAKEEADRLAKLDADKKAKEEADRLAKLEADKKAKEEADSLAKLDADKKAKEEAERLAKLDADKKAKEEAERLAKLDADKKAKEEADRLAKLDADKKAKEEADRLAKLDADKKAKEEADRLAKLDADKKAKEEADRLAKLEADKKAKEEADRLAKLEADKKAKEEADRLAKLDADKKAKEEADRLAKLEADKKAKEEADSLAKLDADKKAKEEAERLAKLDADKKAKEEADRLAKLDADKKAKEEADRLAKLDADKKAKEEADRLAKLEADKKAKEEADRLAKLDADKKAKEEADRLAKLDADKKAKEEADRLAKLDADKKAQEEAKKYAIEEKYKNTIMIADQKFNSKEYVYAKLKYTEASKILPDEEYPKTKLKEIEDILLAQKTPAKKEATPIETPKPEPKPKVELAENSKNKEEFLNELAKKYPQGITEEEIVEESRTVIRRIVVKGVEAHEYTKVIYSWGTYYFKDGDVPINPRVWTSETGK